MQILSTVTQKGQITIPKVLRDRYNIKSYEQVVLKPAEGYIKIKLHKSFLDKLPMANAPKGKSALIAREEMAKNYSRV